MAAEGTERLLDGLLVTDIGIDGIEAGQLGATLGRDMESALGQENEQADGLQRDSLASRIGTSDDERAGSGLGIDIDRDDRGGIKQGMTGMKEVDGRPLV